MGILNFLSDWFGKQNNFWGTYRQSVPSSSTSDNFQKAPRTFNISDYLIELKPLTRNRIDLITTPCEEALIKTGESKIGGLPDLKHINNWPKTDEDKSMSFIAQLNCEQLSMFDKEKLLPEYGLISFFYCADQSAWGFDPKDKQRFSVLFTIETDQLKRIEFPQDLPDESKYLPNKVAVRSVDSLPNWESGLIDTLIDEEDMDAYIELSSDGINHIFGYPNCIQNPMELECQLVTNGIYCGDASGYQSPGRKELEAGVSDWVLLLQIDSEDDKTGMMWGDAGRLYYWIKKQDLKEKRFDKSWLILQCY